MRVRNSEIWVTISSYFSDFINCIFSLSSSFLVLMALTSPESLTFPRLSACNSFINLTISVSNFSTLRHYLFFDWRTLLYLRIYFSRSSTLLWSFIDYFWFVASLLLSNSSFFSFDSSFITFVYSLADEYSFS